MGILNALAKLFGRGKDSPNTAARTSPLEGKIPTDRPTKKDPADPKDPKGSKGSGRSGRSGSF
ncbi:MAG: hypothetical protein Q4G64_06160 [bacterium]|nr:hypothetical protein [bacterium]